ncbi:MAG TPA: hypothetical protein VG328_06305 [Stellaceae bacterium]|jgi:hypothetical protein|nr:hypothetical protein [Stellaceae bacterium]
MSERVESALHLHAMAERLRNIASAKTALSPGLERMARDLEDEARKLEAAARRDLGKVN